MLSARSECQSRSQNHSENKPWWTRTLVLHFDIDETILDWWDSSRLAHVYWGSWDRVNRRSWEMREGPCLSPTRDSLVSYADLFVKKPMSNTSLKMALMKSFGQMVRTACRPLPTGCGENVTGTALSGHRYLTPALFRLVEKLEQDSRDFRIVFRTFGFSMPGVIREWNSFAAGDHLFAKKPRPELEIRLPRDSGEWYRTPAGPVLALTSLAVATKYSEDDRVAAAVDYKKVLPLTTIHGIHRKDGQQRPLNRSPWQQAWEAMENAIGVAGSRRSWSQVLALRDHFEPWADSGAKGSAGKLLVVDPAALTRGVHHIFFDDGGRRIVDARDEHGEPLRFSEVEKKHVWPVDPNEVVLNIDYFVKAVAHSESLVPWEW